MTYQTRFSFQLIKLYRNFWVDKNNIQRRFEQIHYQGTPYIAVAKGKTSGASNYPDTVASRSFRYDGITEHNKQPFNRGTSLVKPHPLPRYAEDMLKHPWLSFGVVLGASLLGSGNLPTQYKDWVSLDQTCSILTLLTQCYELLIPLTISHMLGSTINPCVHSSD